MRKNPVRTKLRSQEGASILFALFFFIVCSVIGSIVLTAATAAAGRMKDVEQNNKNYYAVNSAANLLESVVNDPTQTKVEITARDVVTELYNDNVAAPSNPKPTYDWSTVKPDENKVDVLAKALFDRIDTGSEGLRIQHNGDDQLDAKIWRITNPESTTDPDDSKCYNRDIQIASTDGKYSLILNCVAHVDTREDSRDLGTVVTYSPGTGKNETRSIQYTATRTITWTVTSVTKGGPVE